MDPLMKYINRISRLAILYRSERLAPAGLNGYQNVYIQHICRNPGVTQDQLAKMIFVNKSNVARQLAVLEQTGFILRKTSETDRRQMQVYPTDKAQAVFPKVREVLHELNEQLMSGFSEEEQTLLLTMMEKIMDKALQLTEQINEQDKE